MQPSVDYSAPELRPLLGHVARTLRQITGCETVALVLGAHLFDEPERPFPREWYEAVGALRAEGSGPTASMRPWPDAGGRLRVVMRAPLTTTASPDASPAAAGVPLGDSIAIGGPEAHLDGRRQLLTAFAVDLSVVLARISAAASTDTALTTTTGLAVTTADPMGFRANLLSGSGPTEWLLSLLGRLVRAERVAALVPVGSGDRYAEWPGLAADPAQLAARESLARVIAERDGPATAADLKTDRAVRAAGAADFVGVPFATSAGDPGALLFFPPADRPFTAIDQDAAIALAGQLVPDGWDEDHRIDLESIQAAESRRLAGELHDGPVQQLTGAAMQTEVALKLMERDPQAAATSVQKARDETRRVISQLRTLIFDLRLANVAELGLIDALRDYAQEFGESSGIAVQFVAEGDPLRLPAATEQTLFLIAREALHNIDKHARATAVTVTVSFAPDLITVRVEDNGVGFDVDSSLASALATRHFGLVGMRERAERLRGRTTIRSQPNVGTIVEVAIPRPDGV